MIELNLEEEKDVQLGAKIKVIGVGGAGGNAVNSMTAQAGVEKVEFVLANTDAQALESSPIEHKLQLGNKVTKGLGAGSNPDIGRRAAEEDLDEVMKHVGDADILFLTAGLGGGTGSGALPVIAQAAHELGMLTVAIVTKPFTFEGKRRMRHAQEAIETLKSAVDTLIVVPNQRLLELVDPKISMLDAFALSNSILNQAIRGISDIITRPGHINVDFADVRSVMKDMGMALMGTGTAEGEGRATQAAHQAISSQLLEDVSIAGAQGVLLNITGNTDLGLHEINEAASVVYDMVSEDANIILGSVIDPEIGNEIKVTVIATGFDGEKHEKSHDDEEVAYAQPAQVKAPHEIRLAPSEEAHNTQPQPEAQQSQATEPEGRAHDGAVPAGKQAAPLVVDTTSELSSLSNDPISVEQAFDMSDLDTPAFLRKKSKRSKQK